jgi:hypothetical protein
VLSITTATSLILSYIFLTASFSSLISSLILVSLNTISSKSSFSVLKISLFINPRDSIFSAVFLSITVNEFLKISGGKKVFASLKTSFNSSQ